jgi:hypothetical protein
MLELHYCFWPWVHAINFSFVPLHGRYSQLPSSFIPHMIVVYFVALVMVFHRISCFVVFVVVFDRTQND